MQGVDVDHVRRFADDCLTLAALGSFVVEQRALVRELPAVLGALAEVRVPTTVLTGDRDRMIAPCSARHLADAIPGAELRTIPGAGHYLPGSHPTALAEAVLAAATRAGRR
jgi:pimeloyl-ACP methyl ester carboxylesterase